MVRRVAIIPARGGSKRIPKKNIMEFKGKPMIAWTISAARDSKMYERIIVSTDDEEIAEVSKKYGAEIPFLREEHVDDHSTVSQAVAWTLKRMKEIDNIAYDNVTSLMPNCPMRDSAGIIDSLKNFESKDLTFQISCFEYGWMNPWWAFKISPKGDPEAIFKDVKNVRSQDLDKLYCPTGAIWIAKAEALEKSEDFYGEGFELFPISWKDAVDIDNYEDLEIARALYEQKDRN